MAHFAKLDDNNVVKQVIVVHNNELLDDNGNESEQKGIEFCQSLFGGNWIQTSYNNKFRNTFAGVGYVYDPQRNAFIAPRPEGEGWEFDEESLTWINNEFIGMGVESPYI